MSRSIKRKKRNSVSQRRSRNKQVKADYNSLEQRLVLTTFVVTSLADGVAEDGLITLREAVQASNTNTAVSDAAAGDETGDIIRFDSSLAGGTINLTQGQLNVFDDVAIQAGNLDITVDAQGLSRAFQTFGTQTISFGRVNVTGGVADIGGGILASGSGNVIVFGGEYSGNEATGEGGGAIYSASGDLNISGGTIFESNVASGASGSGGAIFNDSGMLNANDVEFTANVANRAGGAVEINGGDLFLTNIEASENIAGATGLANPGNGGAVHVTAGDIVVVTDSLISNNFAAREGGGLWNQAGTRMFVNGTTFDSNIAAGLTADDGGGAIFNNGGDLIINNSTFDDNTATGTAGSGGAIFSVDGRVLVQENSRFSSNLSSRAGGAVELVDGEFFDTGSTYIANDTGVSRSASPGNGGAFHITGAGTSVFNGTRFIQNLAASEGGAVWNSAESTTFLTDVLFSENVASGDLADNGGGAVFNNGGDVIVNKSVFDENVADGTAGSGGAIFSVDGLVSVRGGSEFIENISTRAGGAIELVDGSFDDTNSLFFSNDTGVTLPASPGNGGAFHITGTGVSTFTGSQFVRNSAGSEGGAVWNSADSTMFLTDVEFSDNVASGNSADNGGGAVFNNGGEVFINSSVFKDNLADGTAGSGGAILSVDGRVLVQADSVFESNLSTRAGGAVEIIDGEFFDTDSVYTSNETGTSLGDSPGNGAAFHITGTATAAFNGTEFVDNLAGAEGGAVWNSATSTTFLTNVQITENVANGTNADNGGGGIFNNGGSVFVSDSTISGNIARAGSGGGALSVDGVIRFDNSTISENEASQAGGGVEVIDGRAVFSGVTLDSNTAVSFPVFATSSLVSDGQGGALRVSGNETVVTFSDSTISNNSAGNQGGGLWNQTGSTLILNNGATVSGNTTVGLGGGVYNRGLLEAIDSVFSGNEADEDGGGIYVTESGNTSIENSTITANEAGNNGGGVLNLGNFEVSDSSLTNNIAGTDGGAIFASGESFTSVGFNNVFAGNVPNDVTDPNGS